MRNLSKLLVIVGVLLLALALVVPAFAQDGDDMTDDEIRAAMTAALSLPAQCAEDLNALVTAEPTDGTIYNVATADLPASCASVFDGAEVTTFSVKASNGIFTLNGFTLRPSQGD